MTEPTEEQITDLLNVCERFDRAPWETPEDYDLLDDPEIKRHRERLEILTERTNQAEMILQKLRDDYHKTNLRIQERLDANMENWFARRRVWAIEVLKETSQEEHNKGENMTTEKIVEETVPVEKTTTETTTSVPVHEEIREEHRVSGKPDHVVEETVVTKEEL